MFKMSCLWIFGENNLKWNGKIVFVMVCKGEKIF